MKWQVFAGVKVISAPLLLRLLPLSGGKGHVVLCVQQMPWRGLATDESKMSVTCVKQAKPRNTDIWQDDGRRQSLLSPLKQAVNIQCRMIWKAKATIQISLNRFSLTAEVSGEIEHSQAAEARLGFRPHLQIVDWCSRSNGRGLI